jgi:hypothetical protein
MPTSEAAPNLPNMASKTSSPKAKVARGLLKPKGSAQADGARQSAKINKMLQTKGLNKL